MPTVRIVPLLLAAAALCTGCASPPEESAGTAAPVSAAAAPPTSSPVTDLPLQPTVQRGPQRIMEWSADGAALQLGVASCNGDPEASVVETGTDVTVTVVATVSSPSDMCMDVVTVTLASPLDDRVVIDGATGHEVEHR